MLNCIPPQRRCQGPQPAAEVEGHAEEVALGVLPGALIVALVEVLAAQYLDPIMVNSASFIVLLLALWIRPWGFFGTREEIERV